jgi:transcriptional regulator GlxA family with amidase domain
MRIAILALEGLFDTGLTSMLDAFTTANELFALQMAGTPHFHVSIVGVRRKVKSGQGLAIPVQVITPELKPDWVIVPALSTKMPDQLIPALSRPDMLDAKSQLLKWHGEEVCLAASCIGTFLLAETGLLNVSRQPPRGGWAHCFGRDTRR